MIIFCVFINPQIKNNKKLNDLKKSLNTVILIINLKKQTFIVIPY